MRTLVQRMIIEFRRSSLAALACYATIVVLIGVERMQGQVRLIDVDANVHAFYSSRMTLTDGSPRARDELGFAQRSRDLSTPFVVNFREPRSISGNGVTFESTVSVEQDTRVTFTDGNLAVNTNLLSRVENEISGNLGALDSATGGGSASTYLVMNIQLDSPADVLVNGMMSVAGTPPGPDPVSDNRIETSFKLWRFLGPAWDIGLDHKFFGTATAPIDISASLPAGQYQLDVRTVTLAASSPPLQDAKAMLDFTMTFTPPPGFRWTSAAGGDWNVSDHWSAGQPPGESDRAEFHLSDTYTVNFTEAAVSQAALVRNGVVTFQMPDHRLTVQRLEVGGGTSSGATLNVAAEIFHRSGIVADEVVVGRSGVLTNNDQTYVGYTTFSDSDPNRLITDVHARRSLRLENGGRMESTQAKVVGPGAVDGTGVATVNIDGAGSIWEVGNLELGGAASGRINITGGGELNLFPNGRVDAPTMDSESVISVNGFGTLGEQIVPSRLIASDLRIGIDGYARIHVSGRGQVGADSAVLGDMQGSRGIVIVEGTGTRWLGANTEANTIAVGRDGRGELIVRDGADFRASISVGELSSLDEGIVTIDGRGPGTPASEQTFVKSINTYVGRAGLGEMIIRQEAQFEAGTVRIGDLVGGNGLIQVLDSGTKMTVDHFITVGGQGLGGLLIKDGAVVEGPLALVTVEGGGVVEIRNNARLIAGGVNIDPGGAVVGDDRSLLVLPGEEFLVNDGILRMGSSPGGFTIDGNYRQGQRGMMEIELAGASAVTEHDQLIIIGDAEIGGIIQLKFLDGFVPQQGQQFEFLSVDGSTDLSGASYEVQNLAPGFEFNIAPSANGISMTALTDGVYVQPVSWNVDADGNWSSATNWDTGDPNADYVSASFLDVATDARTVNVDEPKTVAGLTFDNANSYRLAGPGTLRFNNGGHTSIQVTTGEHLISAPVSIAEGTTLTKRGPGTLTISGAQGHGPGAVLAANGGMTNLNSDGGANLSVHANSHLNFGATQHLAALNIGEDGRATLTAGGTKNLVTGVLSIAGGDIPTGTLDLTDNAAVIDFAGTNPAATVRNQILAGRGAAGFGATWTGSGVTSSTAATQVAGEPESVSIAYAVNGELPLGAYTNFRGETVDESSVLIRYTRTADANLDGLVNDDDVTIVGATYAPGVAQPHWVLGDFDYNGFVDDDDVTLLGAFYDPSAAPLVSGGVVNGEGVAGVPEPAAIRLFATMLCALCAIRFGRLRARVHVKKA